MSIESASSLVAYQVTLIIILLMVGLTVITNLRTMERAAKAGEQELTRPLVSVLVPARNEARNIAHCLQSLLSQDYPKFEVLVLDDNSTDKTADIVAQIARIDPKLRLVRGQPLPQGWMGKNYACHQLAQAARGEWLLFTDADTRHHPGALAWAIGVALGNQADLVSIVPRTMTHTVGEEILLPMIPFGLLGCFPWALGRRLRISFLAVALGTFMLFRRESYHLIDGHRAVQGAIAEDVVLARKVQRAGGSVVLVDGSDRVDVHFYTGFWESWRGLAKSVFAALEYRLLPALLMMGLYGFLFLWPMLILLSSLVLGRGDTSGNRLAVVAAFLNSVLWYAVAVRFRLPRRTALLYPLTILLTILIVLDSILRAAFSGIGWKGRIYHWRGGALRH